MPPKTVSRLGLRLTPQGHLVSEKAEDSPDLEDKIAARLVDAFAQGSGHGLMWLGAGEVGQALPPVFCWWHDFAAQYVGGLCLQSSGTTVTLPPPDDGDGVTLPRTEFSFPRFGVCCIDYPGPD